MRRALEVIVRSAVIAALLVACAPADDQPAGSETVPAASETALAASETAPPAEVAAPTAQSPAPPQPAGAPAAPVYLDVRTPAEYQAGHVQGAILLPVEQLEQRWQELERYRDQPLVVYCRTGRRSALALQALEARGFTQLEDGGGMAALASARGLTITTAN